MNDKEIIKYAKEIRIWEDTHNCKMNLEEAEICSNCKVICTIDDECYVDYKTNKPLCDRCSVYDEEVDNYTLREEVTE